MTAEASIRVNLVDNASKGLANLEAQAKQSSQAIAESAKQSSKESEQAAKQSHEETLSGFKGLEQKTKEIQQQLSAGAKKTYQEMADAAKQSTASQHDTHIKAYQEMNDARQKLGVRAHSLVRQEIADTRAAYQVLSRSGVSSWQEQVQAAEAYREKIKGLTNEMGELTATQKASNAAGSAATLVAGLVGAAYTTNEQLNKAIDLDARLTQLVVTANPEYDARGVKVGVNQYREAVYKARKEAGIGTNSDYIDSLSALIDGGDITGQAMLDFLPTIGKGAAGTDMSAEKAARFANALYGSGWVTDKKGLATAFNMMRASSNEGELSGGDLVESLIKQIPMAKKIGYEGLSGLQELLVTNQASATTAGDAKSAGTNVENMLSKLNAPEIQKRFADKRGDEYRERHPELKLKSNKKITDQAQLDAMDLTKVLQKGAIRGLNAMQVWEEILMQDLKADPVSNQLLQQAAKEKDDSKRAGLIKSLTGLQEGKIFTQYFTDMQASSAIAGRLNKSFADRVSAAVNKNRVVSGGTADNAYQVYKGTAANSYLQLKETNEQQQMRVVSPHIDKAKKVADEGRAQLEKHQYLASGITAGEGALMAIGGVSVLGAAIPSVRTNIAAKATAAYSRASALYAQKVFQATAFLNQSSSSILRATPAITRTAAAAVPNLLKGGLVTGVATIGADYAIDRYVSRQSNWNRYGHAAITGTALGATVGSVIPVAGTATGAVVGGVLGLLAQGVADAFRKQEPKPQPDPKPIKVDTQTHVTVALAPGLVPVAQSSKSTSTGTGANTTSATVGAKANTGNIFTGAPR